MSEIYPQRALDSLTVIKFDKLSDTDKEYYDFLWVKTRDKSFITHTSDSLILNVIDNEERHRSRGRYAEALYYGGRVYHDMGDYPSALNYYHSALDNIGNDNSNKLKGSILVQIGAILNSMRLYDQAIPYINRAIAIDSINRDTLNLMYDTELLGSIYLRAENYDLAEAKLRYAQEIAQKICHKDTALLYVNAASIKYNKNEIDSALYYIQQALNMRDTVYDSKTLAYASLIYNKSGIQDSAMIYARQLIGCKFTDNHRIAYKVLISPEMREHISTDTLNAYILRLYNELESYMNKNGNQSALIQNSFYNYQLHLHKKIETERANERLSWWLAGMILVVLSLFAGILYLKYRNKSRLLQLHEAIDTVNTLRRELDKKEINNTNPENNDASQSENVTYSKASNRNIQELKTRLREDILSLGNNENFVYTVPVVILKSDAYKKVIQYINAGKIISDKDPLWIELEKIVTGTSPDLKNRLNILTGGKMKSSDFHLALLIKCGISTTGMSSLVGRAKATIVYRRKKLGFKIFDKESDTTEINKLIQLL